MTKIEEMFNIVKDNLGEDKIIYKDEEYFIFDREVLYKAYKNTKADIDAYFYRLQRENYIKTIKVSAGRKSIGTYVNILRDNNERV